MLLCAGAALTLVPPFASAVVPPAGASSAPAARATQPAPIVSGDLIVKFRDASEPGRQLAAVLAGQRTVASVAPLAARLSSELELPLVLVQVTSGREALLAIDREALARSLLARAGREAAVQRATMTVPPSTSGLPGAELVLHIELRPRTAAMSPESLAARLAVGSLVRPRVADDGGGAWRLQYDLDALTLALVARLQQRADVEYAQANRLLRAMPPPAAGASR